MYISFSEGLVKSSIRAERCQKTRVKDRESPRGKETETEKGWSFLPPWDSGRSTAPRADLRLTSTSLLPSLPSSQPLQLSRHWFRDWCWASSPASSTSTLISFSSLYLFWAAALPNSLQVDSNLHAYDGVVEWVMNDAMVKR